MPPAASAAARRLPVRWDRLGRVALLVVLGGIVLLYVGPAHSYWQTWNDARAKRADLPDLYGRGTDWCLELAVTTAPDDPRAWDAQTAADAAFARYVREAADYAGGRRVGESA